MLTVCEHAARLFWEPGLQYVSQLAEMDVNIEIEWAHSILLLLTLLHMDKCAELSSIDWWSCSLNAEKIIRRSVNSNVVAEWQNAKRFFLYCHSWQNRVTIIVCRDFSDAATHCQFMVMQWKRYLQFIENSRICQRTCSAIKYSRWLTNEIAHIATHRIPNSCHFLSLYWFLSLCSVRSHLS